MKKAVIVLFFILALIPIAMFLTTRQAESAQKPQVILFHTHGCSACKQLMPTFDRLASKYSSKFNFSKQDANSSKLANKLNVNSVPSVFIINTQTGAASPISYDCLQQQGCFEKTLKNY